MMIDVSQQHDVTIIAFAGNYVSLNPDLTRATAESVLAATDAMTVAKLVMDLSLAEYIGSVFLELLIRAWRRTRVRQGQMVLCGLNEFCGEVIQTTGLNRLWDLYSSREEAVAALRQP